MLRSLKPAHNHIVQFYERDNYLCEVVARFLAEGLRVGHSVIAIVTPEHRLKISNELRREGVVPEAAILAGQLTFCDARSALCKFMVDDRPDPEAFNKHIGCVIEEIRNRRRGMAVRAFGEMVDLLCRDGNVQGAAGLESLWNQLASAQRFALLCAYYMGNFRNQSDTYWFRSVCDEHAFVLPTENYTDIQDEDARLCENSRLQQDAEIQEVALAQSCEANRLKDEFLATVSPELRTPLSTILGWNHLAENTSDPAIVQHTFAVIHRNAQMQLHLVDDLLEVSSIITGKLQLNYEAVDLDQLVNAAVTSIQAAALAKDITIDININRLLPRVIGDPDRLHQILWNLLSNSVKFTPDCGRVEVRAKAINGYAYITVRDTGIGIEAEFLPHVFKQFRQADNSTTRENSGLGLGLAIVHHLVDAHGGSIKADSPGKDLGSIFTVCLPLEAAAAMAS